MRKTYTLIVMLAMLFVGANSVSAQVVQGDYTFGFYNSGKAYISAYTGTDTEITIPASLTYDKAGVETTVAVAGFGANSFEGNTTIQKIHLPLNDTYTLGKEAFKGCTALNTLNFAENSGATGTLITDKYIIIPQQTLNEGVFEGCTSIENVYAKPQMRNGIGAKAFKGCTSLKWASISAGCTSIGESAFEGCTALTTVQGCRYKYVTTSATTYYTCTIGNNAFKNCTSLKFFGSSTTYAYLGSNGNTGNFSSVTSIGDNAFENCIGFTRAYFHRVTNIGAEAFKGCTSLQYVFVVKADGDYNVLKSGDTDITEITLGEGVFENCTNLVHLYHDVFARGEGNTVTQTFQPNILFTAIPARAFYGCSKLTIIGGTGSASTTTTSTSLYGGACFPNVTSIGESAFEGCVALASYLNLSTSKPTIGANAFKGCTALTRFGSRANAIEAFGASVGANAFQNTLPTTLYLGEDLANIGASAFEGCSALATIWMYRMDAPSVGEDAFKDIVSTATFFLAPTNSYTKISTYALDNTWKTFFDGTKANYTLFAYVNKSKQYGTVSCDVPLWFRYTSVKDLYKVVAADDAYSYLKTVTKRRLPANTGAVIEMGTQTQGDNAGQLYTSAQVQVLFDGSETSADFTGNLLVANVTENTSFVGNEGNTWNLIMNDGKFVKAENGTLAAGLAYLPVTFEGGEAKELSLTTDEPTGIRTIDNGEPTVDNGAWYTIDGTRLQGEPTMKGIYVRGGKKIVVK